MAALTCAVVSFDGENAASVAYADARDRSGPHAQWSNDVGIVEHFRHGHLLLRGMFAGHYLDVDESDHVSQSGAGAGAATGGLIGVLGGPPGIAVGLLVGGLVGSQTGNPTDVEQEPQQLAGRLREAIPRGSSAIVLFAADDEVDEMLGALGEKASDPLRVALSNQETAALEASLGSAPG